MAAWPQQLPQRKKEGRAICLGTSIQLTWWRTRAVLRADTATATADAMAG